MKVEVRVDPTAGTKAECALVELVSGSKLLGSLDIEYKSLLHLRHAPDEAHDFLLIASTVYALDKLVARRKSDDAWTRTFEVQMPVAVPGRWDSAQRELNSCLSFLTGDRWFISFTTRSVPVPRPRMPRHAKQAATVPQGHMVSLFSGGLDSLVGIIDRLEHAPHERLFLVGHHDGQVTGPLGDQQRLLRGLRAVYGDRVTPILTRVGHTGKADEITLRSRSLVFLSLAVYVASTQRRTLPILIPENGTIAVNVPLTPSRRGSCSTRTTHPAFLAELVCMLAKLGLPSDLCNPFELTTKGEMVRGCRNQSLLQQLAPNSVSCAKRGHKRWWKDRSAHGCGRCMPCIYRRAALHSAALDTERYGNDVCAGDVEVDASERSSANDFRACLSFLRSNPSRPAIENMLLANGSLEPARLPLYTDLVVRAMNEVRTLLRAKAVPAVVQAAGL